MHAHYFQDAEAGEFQRHASAAEAMAVASETLAYYRDEAALDGEWSSAVEGVTVGVVDVGTDGFDACRPTHRATAVGDDTGGYDYAMRPVCPEAAA